MSINLTPAALSCFIQTNMYQNIYEWADEQASLSGRPKDECLKEKLGNFYNRRIAFDKAFHEGELFRYGSLNGGTGGFTEKYGKFCIVVKNDFIENIEIAYFPGDTLTICFNQEGNLDLQAVLPEITPPFPASYSCCVLQYQ